MGKKERKKRGKEKRKRGREKNAGIWYVNHLAKFMLRSMPDSQWVYGCLKNLFQGKHLFKYYLSLNWEKLIKKFV